MTKTPSRDSLETLRGVCLIGNLQEILDELSRPGWHIDDDHTERLREMLRRADELVRLQQDHPGGARSLAIPPHPGILHP